MTAIHCLPSYSRIRALGEQLDYLGSEYVCKSIPEGIRKVQFNIQNIQHSCSHSSGVAKLNHLWEMTERSRDWLHAPLRLPDTFRRSASYRQLLPPLQPLQQVNTTTTYNADVPRSRQLAGLLHLRGLGHGSYVQARCPRESMFLRQCRA